MSLLSAIDVNATGLSAQRRRVELASSNLANSQTTRTEEGGPYRRKDLVFQTVLGEAAGGQVEGVEVAEIIEDPRPFDRRYEPGHPDADAEGYVAYPNVSVMEEMVNLTSASRSYEANLSAINVLKTMINRTLEIGR